jgi:hypothetical protein
LDIDIEEREMLDVIIDTLLDVVKLLPFLYITYVFMEYIEHKMTDKNKEIIEKSGKAGPLFGGLLGMIPQCGFSAAGSNLYVGRIITIGTLIAVYLSTSDEMIPILISEKVSIISVIKIIAIKALIGIIAGFIIDLVLKGEEVKKEKLEDICDHDNVDAKEDNLFISALKHTLNISLYLLIFSFILNTLFHLVGEESLSNLLYNKPVIGNIISGLIGLIPNCAASIVLTEMYLTGVIGFGQMMSGLLVGAGVGIMVLIKNNKNAKENLRIIITLYLLGVVFGTLLEFLPANLFL